LTQKPVVEEIKDQEKEEMDRKEKREEAERAQGDGGKPVSISMELPETSTPSSSQESISSPLIVVATPTKAGSKIAALRANLALSPGMLMGMAPMGLLPHTKPSETEGATQGEGDEEDSDGLGALGGPGAAVGIGITGDITQGSGKSLQHDTLSRPSPGKRRRPNKGTLTFKSQDFKSQDFKTSSVTSITTATSVDSPMESAATAPTVETVAPESTSQDSVPTTVTPTVAETLPIQYRAMFDCPDASVSLPFQTGDVVELVSVQGEWMEVLLKGNKGFVPRAFFQQV